MTTAAQDTNHVAPWTTWHAVRDYVNKAWDPENCPHHVIVGLTGSGKTYLTINGILKPMCSNDRVLVIDTKQDDPLLMSVGKPIKHLPRDPWYTNYNQRDKPERWWYRLVVSENPKEGHDQMVTALNQVYEQGDWVVVVDEAFDVSSRESPYFSRSLFGVVQKIQRKGRTRRVSMISATQEPVGVARIFFSQASFAWMGRVRDEERQKRLGQIGGMTRHELPLIASLQRRQWLLAADNGEYFARTVVTGK